jgi:hypothetical protein
MEVLHHGDTNSEQVGLTALMSKELSEQVTLTRITETVRIDKGVIRRHNSKCACT